MAGLVKRLHVISDTRDQLEMAISILMVWNYSASSFVVMEEAEVPSIYICWGGCQSDDIPTVNFFPTPLVNPKDVAAVVWSWLQRLFDERRIRCHFGGDGDYSRGFIIENVCGGGDRMLKLSGRGVYPFFKVTPHYVYYSK